MWCVPMDTMLLKDQNWDQICRRSGSGPPQVISLYLGDDELSAAGLTLGADGRLAQPKPFSFNGTKTLPLAWRGVGDIFVSPARMGFRCAPDLTYREALIGCLTDAAERLFCTSSNALDRKRSTLVVAQCPEYTFWEKYQADYLELIHGVFADLPLASVGLVALSWACAPAHPEGPYLVVQIGKHWTQFSVRAPKGELLRHTSAALALPEASKYDKPLVMRMNDYVNGSTAVWHEVRTQSWLNAFAGVCHDLWCSRWPIAEQALVLCAPDLFPRVRPILEDGGLLIGSCAPMSTEPACILAGAVGRNLRGTLPQVGRPQTKGSRNRDIFQL